MPGCSITVRLGIIWGISPSNKPKGGFQSGTCKPTEFSGFGNSQIPVTEALLVDVGPGKQQACYVKTMRYESQATLLP